MIVFIDPETKLSSITSTFKDLFSTLAKTSGFSILAGHTSDRDLRAVTLTTNFPVSCRHWESTARPRALHQWIRIISMLHSVHLFRLIQFTMLSRLGTTSCLVLEFRSSLSIIWPLSRTNDLILFALDQSIYSSSTIWNSSYVGIFIWNLFLVSVGDLFLWGFASDGTYTTHYICTSNNFRILRIHSWNNLQVGFPNTDIATPKIGGISDLAIHCCSLSTLGIYTLSAIGTLATKRSTLDRVLDQIARDYEVICRWS